MIRGEHLLYYPSWLTEAWFLFLTTSRWLAVRVDGICSVFVTATAFACLYFRDGTIRSFIFPHVTKLTCDWWKDASYFKGCFWCVTLQSWIQALWVWLCLTPWLWLACFSGASGRVQRSRTWWDNSHSPIYLLFSAIWIRCWTGGLLIVILLINWNCSISYLLIVIIIISS